MQILCKLSHKFIKTTLILYVKFIFILIKSAVKVNWHPTGRELTVLKRR